jgi:hypothetical protein
LFTSFVQLLVDVVFDLRRLAGGSRHGTRCSRRIFDLTGH